MQDALEEVTLCRMSITNYILIILPLHFTSVLSVLFS